VLFRAKAIRPVAGTVCQEVLLYAAGGGVGQRVGLYPSQPLVASRFRRRGLLRPGRTALKLLPNRRHRLSRASQLGLTRRATRVCFRRDTPWVKLAFQASFRCAVLRSMSGCCRASISRARFLSSWQAWMSCCTAQTVRPLTFSRLRVCLSRR